MKLKCQHCGTLCPAGDPHGGFCCPGCRSVAALIRNSGLEAYYDFQDRAGKPVEARAVTERAGVTRKQLAEISESHPTGHRATLLVTGMTCRGCAWLVERLARTSPGIRMAWVSLASSRIELRWTEPFDIALFQEQLNRFGYGLRTALFPGLSLSPLALRLALSALFSVNGGLFLLLKQSGFGGIEAAGLFQLLILANLLLLLLVGAAVFIRPAWDALRLRSWHSDFLPALGLLGLFAWALMGSLLPTHPVLSAGPFLLAVPLLLLARVLTDQLEFRSRLDAASRQSG